MIQSAHELYIARQMLRDGLGLKDAAKAIGWSPSDLDRALWRYAGRREALPKESRTPGHLAGRR